MSCIIAAKHLDDAARAIHAAFFGQAITSDSAERSAKKGAAKRAGRA